MVIVSVSFCHIISFKNNNCVFGFQFSPQVVIISSGYDAAVGCPEVLVSSLTLCRVHHTQSSTLLPPGGNLWSWLLVFIHAVLLIFEKHSPSFSYMYLLIHEEQFYAVLIPKEQFSDARYNQGSRLFDYLIREIKPNCDFTLHTASREQFNV